jgi:23S rRNA (adenine2503-C2)-methyltransferase
MDGKIPLLGLFPEEITRFLTDSAPPGVTIKPFTGTQVFRWLWEGAAAFDVMTNLPLGVRRILGDLSCIRTAAVVRRLEDRDGTVKYHLAFPDGAAAETVLLTDHGGRRTACVSSQAGCALGCAFCQTGALGLTRDLSAAEIAEQFLTLEQAAGPLDNLVFMGMGEPLANLGGVRKAIALLSHPRGRGFSLRRITVSTAGLIAGIYDLADNGPPVRLAVSLTSADPAVRERLMPVAAANPLDRLKEAVVYYSQKSGRRCTLEVALLSGVNTDGEQARLLASFARDTGAHVNLIPWNSVASLPFQEPPAAECRAVLRILKQAHVPATLRTHRGRNVAGACGQLGTRRLTPD